VPAANTAGPALAATAYSWPPIGGTGTVSLTNAVLWTWRDSVLSYGRDRPPFWPRDTMAAGSGTALTRP
jgi:hypothetical protein